jgi:peptidoglycan/LPS O-acetylase OafA/YrhL
VSGTAPPDEAAASPFRGGHIPALDAVRGVAILLVLVFHFSLYGHGLTPAPLLLDRLYYRLAGAGWIGVDLFFVLSGFLITGILYDAKTGAHYFRTFYVRRVLRIFPVYYVTLAVFLVALPLLLPQNAGLQSLKREAAWYWTYLVNAQIARSGWPGFPALGHFWSLAVEEQFYLVWPVVVLALSARRLEVACLAGVVGSLGVRVGLHLAHYETAAIVLTPARIDALAVGAYVAVAARRPGGLDRLSRWARPSATVLGVALLGLFVLRMGLADYDPAVSTLGYTILACLFGSLLVLALTSPPDHLVARTLDSSFLRFFGRYSYALYVFHHPILFFGLGVVALQSVPVVGGSQMLRQLVFLVVATGVSVGIALVSWHAVERQALRLKRFFPYTDATRNPGGADDRRAP